MAGFQLVVLSEISQDQNETSSLKRKYSRYRKQKYFQSLHEELSQKISVPVFRDTRLCILPETREFSELMDSLPVAGGFRCRRSLTRRNVLSETGRRLTFWHCLRCVSFRTRTRPARAPESSVHCSVPLLMLTDSSFYACISHITVLLKTLLCKSSDSRTSQHELTSPVFHTISYLCHTYHLNSRTRGSFAVSLLTYVAGRVAKAPSKISIKTSVIKRLWV
ncbi:uncharacterized protein LOC121028322 isoform X2 [Herpailurus yagouaroundi]|uniref:uncharacterized protein LOC121028322 isoform X2 n=1 Tax=Herpailurus yagouaroundi TaxID=1608482 RepID=UPI001AD64BFA|nr:uncharacterized protein LOC121028322 isoform X2 [Puma yagouaroundi]